MRFLIIVLVFLVACDTGPSGEECLEYEDEAACKDAGCYGFVRYVNLEVRDGVCYQPTNMILDACVVRESGIDGNSNTVYSRASDPSDFRRFSSDNGPMDGWDYCDDLRSDAPCKPCLESIIVVEQ